MDSETTRRRLRAARVLADLTVEQLAAKLGAGLGSKTLGAIERGEREVRAMELREIARACELPYEWFTVDFDRLPDISPAAENPKRTVEQMRNTAILRRLERIEQTLGIADAGQGDPAEAETPGPDEVTPGQREAAATALEAELEDAARQAREPDEDTGEDEASQGHGGPTR